MATARRVFIKSIRIFLRSRRVLRFSANGGGGCYGFGFSDTRTPIPWTPDSISNLLSKEIGCSISLVKVASFFPPAYEGRVLSGTVLRLGRAADPRDPPPLALAGAN